MTWRTRRSSGSGRPSAPGGVAQRVDAEQLAGARALGAPLVVAGAARGSRDAPESSVASAWPSRSSGTLAQPRAAHVDAQRPARAASRARRAGRAGPVWAPAQSFSTREQSRASSTRSGGSAPATSHSARQSATQTAAEEDRPAPRGRSLAISRRQRRSSTPSRASSAAAPRTSARQPSARCPLGAKLEAVASRRGRPRAPRSRCPAPGSAATVTPRSIGEGQAQAVVVVGVLADQVDAARGERLDTPSAARGVF